MVAAGVGTIAPLVAAYLTRSAGDSRNLSLLSSASAFAFFPLSVQFFLPANAVLKDLSARADGSKDGKLSTKEESEVERAISEWDGYQPLRVVAYGLAWVTSLAAFTLGVRTL